MENEKATCKPKVHMGRNVRKFRQLRDMKQLALGELIGIHSQQSMSVLENREVIEVEILEKIAPVLGVSVQVLQTLPEEEHGNITIEYNTFQNGSFANIAANDIEGQVYENHPVDQLLDFFKGYMEEERKERKELLDRLRNMEELIRKVAK